MIDFTALLNRMIEVFLFLCVGYAGRRTRALDDESNRALSRIIVHIGIPALILSAMMNADAAISARKLFLTLGMGTLWQLFLMGLGFLLARVLAREKSERGNVAFLLAFGNIGIFGLSVIKPLFGSDGVLLASFFNLPFNFLAYTVGVLMLQGGRREGQKLWKLLLTPAVVVAALVPLLYLLRITYPQPLKSAVTLLGDMALPLLMFTVGSTLATMRPRELFTSPRLLAIVGLRLLVVPVLCWAVFGLFVRDSVLLGILTILTGMPVAGISTALNILYGTHEKEASAAVFLTTLLSLATIPLLTWLLLM